MRKLLIIFCKNPWLVLFSLTLVSLLAFTQLKYVEVRVSAEELLIQDDPERTFYKEVTKQFGDEKIILLYLSGDDILKKEKLEELKHAINKIESFEFVNRVESLFSVPYLKTVDGYLNKDPYLISLPENAQSAKLILENASLNPFVQNTLLSEDHSTMALAIILNTDLSKFTDESITESLAVITDQLKPSYPTAFTISYQHVRTEVSQKIKDEQSDLFPLAIAALLITLFLILRQLLDIFIPVLTAGISILWTLGIMGYLNIPLNVVTSIVPILLIIVGSTEDIHLISEFRRGRKNGLDKTKAIEQMSIKMGGIVVLTFITTFIGFLSVGLSKIEVLWQFGTLSAAALMFNFIITISLIPALLRIAGDWQLDGKSSLYKSNNFEPKLAKKFYRFLHKFRWGIGAMVLLISIVSVVGIYSIKINHNAIDSLSSDSQVRQHFSQVNEKLSGLESMSVIIDSGIQDTFLKVRYLEQLKMVQDYIQTQPGIRSTTSFANYLSLLNGAFEEQDDPLMPDSDEIINELMIFLKYDHVKAYVSDDYSRVRLLIRHKISSTHDLQAVVNNLNLYIKENLDKGLDARITGDSVLTLSATKGMIQGQLQSILLLLIIIIVIISGLFLDWKVGIIAAIPNIFPVLVLFGIMGFANIPLNIGTTMAAAIAIGIAVDDTMHFMLRYNKELKVKKSQMAAMYETLHSEALPVFATSFSLIAGFLVFSLSDFEPIAQFGFLSALVMLAALIADFVITPLVISTLRLVTVWDLISLSIREEVIKKSEIFKGMKSWQIRKFILASTVRHCKKNESIFIKTDESESMFLVLRGNVEVTHPTLGNDIPVKELFTPGNVFGDVSMFAQTLRATDAIATEQTSLLILTREGINNSTYYYPMISAKLFFNIATHVSKRFAAVMKQRIDIPKRGSDHD